MSDKKEKPEINIDLGLGNLFKGINNLVDLVSDLSEKGEKRVEKSGEFSGEGNLKDLKGVYGFSVKMGVGGSPTVESFGNIKKTEKGAVVEEIREPLVDVFDEDAHIQIIAELPGIEDKDIQAELKDDVLILRAENQNRKYSKEILLSSKVQPDSLTRSYKNGILEIKLNRAE